MRKRKPSDILQLAIDLDAYNPYKRDNALMCDSLWNLRSRGVITFAECWLTVDAISEAINGEACLFNYLRKELGLEHLAARDPFNKLAFYKGLIKRLKDKGI